MLDSPHGKVAADGISKTRELGCEENSRMEFVPAIRDLVRRVRNFPRQGHGRFRVRGFRCVADLSAMPRCGRDQDALADSKTVPSALPV